MKEIPIYIVSFDRLGPLKHLVDRLLERRYNNITLIDTGSTYPPLLEWYKLIGLKIVRRPGADHQAGEGIVPTDAFYVYTDNDCVPVMEAPENFIDRMVTVAERLKVDKVGLSLKLDDLPQASPLTEQVQNWEAQWHVKRLPHAYLHGERVPVWRAPVDTTFAVVAPGRPCGLAANAVRLGFPYQARHLPWYYDLNQLPEDERWFREHKRWDVGHWSSL